MELTTDPGLQGKVVLVTGASSGLGAQLARALSAACATPALAARRAERLAELVAKLPGAGAFPCDVTSEDERERLVLAVLERHGRIDGLVNNAGMGATAPALRTSAETFSRVLELNLVAPYALSRLVAAQMRDAAAAQTGGSAAAQTRSSGSYGHAGAIVNVASVMGLRSLGEVPDAAYVASKAGLIGLTRELASQWGRYGIRVNAVAPGFFASEMTSDLGPDADSFPDWLTAQTPLRRGGRPGELDEAILFLLGEGSSFVTGHVLTVDGGLAVR
jgi:NAD(P)-dependent dehydrogenase (short-subunit alcohol dehydrogenase family)